MESKTIYCKCGCGCKISKIKVYQGRLFKNRKHFAKWYSTHKKEWWGQVRAGKVPHPKMKGVKKNIISHEIDEVLGL